MSWAEAKWTVDSIVSKTGQQPNHMRRFVAFPVSSTSVGLNFLEPKETYMDGILVCAIGGVMIRMSDKEYPTSPNDGDLVLVNTELGKYNSEDFIVEGLTEGKTYYFSAFPFSTTGVYNLSSNMEQNRETAIPVDGEKVTVNIDIDDASAFGKAIVTCLDETDSSKTQIAELTAIKKSGNFAVIPGHKYHLEYGDVEDYIKPVDTVSKVAVAKTNTEVAASYSYFVSTIAVTYPKGATVTCSKGDITYTAEGKNGSHVFNVHKEGNWVIKAVDGDNVTTATVQITASKESKTVELSFIKIYGISRLVSNPSPVWERTDDAVGKTATASLGTVAGHSDFSTCYPWSEMKRQTFDQGDVMVKIPEFWYKRYVDNSVEHIKIADRPAEGFEKHPGSGCFVGAYKTSVGDKSISNVLPLVSISLDSAKISTAKKGAGWGVSDISVISAIRMLYLVEFATNDSQKAIGDGYTPSTEYGVNYMSTGNTDSIPNLTGQIKNRDIVYRGIEAIWGGVGEVIDGLSISSGRYTVRVFGGQSKQLSYVCPKSPGYLTNLGIDPQLPWVMLPADGQQGSNTIYYTDYVNHQNSGSIHVLITGSGYNNINGMCGIFSSHLVTPSSSSNALSGYRLMYKPE